MMIQHDHEMELNWIRLDDGRMDGWMDGWMDRDGCQSISIYSAVDLSGNELSLS